MAKHECDVAVIGAGTAGLAAERAARETGATTLLIDPAFGGTTCATVGCMPSKLLLAAAHSAHDARKAALFGVRTGDIAIDGSAVMRRVQEERDKFVAHVLSEIDKIPDEVRIRASARFTGQTELALDNGDVVEARSIVIATGSSPAIPDPFKEMGERVLTNRTIFDLPNLPKSLAVVGAGPLGLELAQAMARLGVDTVLFDQDNAVGKIECPEIERALRNAIAEEMELHLGVELEARQADEGIAVEWSGNGQGKRTFDYILVAAGRPPNLNHLNLGKTSLDLDEHGTPKYCMKTMRCGDAPIFICGDASAKRPVLHEASIEGTIAGRNAVAFPATIVGDRSAPFSMIFTDPPYVHIGSQPDESAVIGSADYSDQGRAKVEARNRGLVRLYAAAPDGRLIGADLCAPGAEHYGHTLAWAIERGATASELLSMPFYHPTLEEGLRPALREICEAVPIAQPADRSSGDPPGS